MEKYIDEERLQEEINKRLFYLVDSSSFVVIDASDYTTIQFNQVEVLNEHGSTTGAIDCSIDLYDDEIVYLSSAKIGYVSPSRGIWNPSIMTVKKTTIQMKDFIQNDDIICMRKNGKMSYQAQFAGAAIGKNYKMIKEWLEYSDETEEYVISASLGYSLYKSVGGSLTDLQGRVGSVESSLKDLEEKVKNLPTGGGSGGNSSTADTANKANQLTNKRQLWSQDFDGTADVKGPIYVSQSPYRIRLGDIYLEANAGGTELKIYNAKTSSTQIALKVSGNIISYA